MHNRAVFRVNVSTDLIGAIYLIYIVKMRFKPYTVPYHYYQIDLDLNNDREGQAVVLNDLGQVIDSKHPLRYSRDSCR